MKNLYHFFGTKKIVLLLVASLLFMFDGVAQKTSKEKAANETTAQRTALRYGSIYAIGNGYANWNGGYLDTCGHASCGDNLYNVSTNPSKDRATGTGDWMVLSATGKNNGSVVEHGDKVYLVNRYNSGQGGYLDVCGRVACGENLYAVSTNASSDRAGQQTATWTIIASKSGAVYTNDVVRFRTSYNNWYLQTCGHDSCGGSTSYDVSVYPLQDRAERVTHWRFSL